MKRLPTIERRLAPNESPAVIAAATAVALLAALLLGSLLFLPLGVNPLQAYFDMLYLGFGSVRSFAFTLVKATPLIFVALGTIFAWRSGFFYLGFEGALLMGATTAVWLALMAGPDGVLSGLPRLLFFILVVAASFVSGGLWAGIVGFMRARFGGNEVIVSLMMNFVAVFLVQFLVSGPLRAPGDLPQTARIADRTTLPTIIPGTRAHAGILIALAAVFVVWLVLRKTPTGYRQIVTGLNPRAARYGGVNVERQLLLAAFVAGGLAAMAGLVEILGVQFRLLDGLAEGTGFLGIVTALLGKLNALGVVVTSVLYAGMEVGADVMQRRAGVPSSVIFTIQSLIVLLVLASDILRYVRIVWPQDEDRQAAVDAVAPDSETATTTHEG